MSGSTVCPRIYSIICLMNLWKSCALVLPPYLSGFSDLRTGFFFFLALRDFLRFFTERVSPEEEFEELLGEEPLAGLLLAKEEESDDEELEESSGGPPLPAIPAKARARAEPLGLEKGPVERSRWPYCRQRN